MKIFVSFYELEAAYSLNAASAVSQRKGALLKIDFSEGKAGYADCFPWPELGDLSLEQQLDRLARGELTPITRCALEFAKIDAQFRFEGIGCLTSSFFPRSHFLITDLLNCSSQEVQTLIQQGYSHVKVKMGRHIEQEAKRLLELFSKTSLKLRLDFNETLNGDRFAQFLKSIESLKEQIEFIEDPFPFHPGQWGEFQQEGWTLACDRQASFAYGQSDSARVLIVKPAVVSFAELRGKSNQTCIATSYLGHPVGQVAAAYAALQLDPTCDLVHGILSHHSYQPTIFSRQLNWGGPEFIPPSGTGCGFDQDLWNLEWEALEQRCHASPKKQAWRAL